MAELAIGVTTICFPTLPSLLQHRKKKPSNEIINGSAEFRGMKPRTLNTTADRDYFVLEEGRPNVLRPNTSEHLVTEIRGGEEDGVPSSEVGLNSDQKIPPSGIMKMIKIEQSDRFKDP